MTATLPETWEEAPLPILVVEILSSSTRSRDLGPKRDWYLEIGIPEYWVVDGERRVMHGVRAGSEDAVLRDTLRWHRTGAGGPLVIEIAAFFQEALG